MSRPIDVLRCCGTCRYSQRMSAVQRHNSLGTMDRPHWVICTHADAIKDHEALDPIMVSCHRWELSEHRTVRISVEG